MTIIPEVQGKCPYDPVADRNIEMGAVLPLANTTQHHEAMTCTRQEDTTLLFGTCNASSVFRPIDGVCNNLLFPFLGSPMQPFQRLLPPKYDDGIEQPRVESSTSRFRSLPSARAVSTACHSSSAVLQTPDSTRNVLFVFFGQFIDHDITGVPESEVTSPCCPKMRSDGLHPDTLDGQGPCFPIPVPSNDPELNATCLEFSRSEHIEEEATAQRPREQMNSLTSFVDASNVYGSTPADTNVLRSFTNGTMVGSDTCKQLPVSDTFPCVVNTDVGKQQCKAAGDCRVNEVPPLTALHTVFHSLHNKLAQLIHSRYPSLDDNTVFQETRKLVIAIYQQIVFYEWLPLAIGIQGMKLARLNEKYCYNPFLSPNLFNVFSAVCFRFGHSMLPPSFLTRFGRRDLEDTFFRPAFLGGCKGPEAVGVDAMMDGMLSERAKKRDGFFVRAIRDRLFQNVFTQGVPPTDLVARNIQRGRDHGLPPYLDFLKLFQAEAATHHAKPATFSQPCLNAYGNTKADIDMFVGTMTEPAFQDSIQGFLCTRIIGEQFSTLRNADRFFFETPDINIGFSRLRLEHIKRVTMAWVLCATTGVQGLQPHAFLRPDDDNNAMVNCDMLGGPSIRVLTNIGRRRHRAVCPLKPFR